MTISVSDMNAFFGRSSTARTSFSELRPNTSYAAWGLGIPRYTRDSSGILVPTSGPIDLGDYDNAKYDRGAYSAYASSTYSGITSGYRLPYSRYGTNGYGTASNNGYWYQYNVADGSYARVAAYYSGGVLDVYGNTITPATFRYFRVYFSRSSKFYYVNTSSRDIMGYSNNNGESSGYHNVYYTSSRYITIVAKNRV